MGIILVITDHDAVVGVDGADDKYIYEIQYRGKIHLIEVPLEFHDEMSVGDQERFLGLCMIQAFQRVREEKLEERPQEIIDKHTVDADDDDDDDEEYMADSRDMDAIHVVDLINQLVSRIEELEKRLNKDKPKE